MSSRRLLAVVVCLAASAEAQTRSAPSKAALQEDLQRAQAELDRLVRLRLRHDLGLPVPTADSYCALTDTERARSKEAGERQLQDEQARVAALSVRLAAAQDKLAAAQHTVRQAVHGADSEFPIGMTAGERKPEGGEPQPFTLTDEAPAVPAQPAGETAPVASPPSQVDGPEPVLLRGSEDHSRVGRALFFAKRYDRARVELEAATKERADLVDLFYLARACEASGDVAKADEIYLQVEAKDTPEVDGQKQPGPWARAARIARRQMQWMRDNGGWQPARPIEAVQWRKR